MHANEGLSQHGLGTHFLTPFHARPGYRDLCELLMPYYRDRAFDDIIAQARSEHSEDDIAALALFAGRDEEAGLEHAIYGAAFEGRPLPAEEIDRLCDLRCMRWAAATIDRLLHTLVVYAETHGPRIAAADLNEAMLPVLTTDVLKTFTLSDRMRLGVAENGRNVDMVDVTAYDGDRRDALAWLRRAQGLHGGVPDALRRVLAHNEPPIVIV